MKSAISYNFQSLSGEPIANGTVTFTLSTDAMVSDSQINAGRVATFTLDANGNLSGYIWANDHLTPANTTYRVKVYTAQGQLVFEQDMLVPTTIVVTVSPATVSLVEGATQQFTATVIGPPGVNTDVTWSASDGSINSSGLFTAPNTVENVTITATSVVKPSAFGTAVASITAPPCLYFANGSSSLGWHGALPVETLVTGSITSGVFENGETAVQDVTEASGTVVNATPGSEVADVGIYPGPLALAYPVTGTPDATHAWVGQTSGAVFTPDVEANYVNPQSTFYMSDTGTYVNASFASSLTFDFILQTTTSGNEDWWYVMFGESSSGHGPNLILYNNYGGNTCGFNIQSNWTPFEGPEYGVVAPSVSKNVWHTIEVTISETGEAVWYLDGVLQSSYNLGLPPQGTYIGFLSTYGNQWLANICSK